MNGQATRYSTIWNMSFGFLGIQFGWGLQMANMSAIYEYLGATPDQIPMLWLAANLEGWAMLGVALLMMLAVFGQIPLNDAIVGRYVADEFRARVLGVRYVVSLGVAAVAVPMIAALHKTAGGFSNVFLVLAVLASGVFFASFFFPTRAELTANKEKLASQPA